MFAPIAVDNIAFPESSSISTLDFIPESFEAFAAYSNYATASTATSQSFTSSIDGIMRWGMGPNNQILGIAEGGGTVFKWDANTDTMTTHGSQSPGSVRNVVWDNQTNSWILCGANSFIKISCVDQTISSSINVPTNDGTQYASVVSFGGKAYALPYVGVTANTAVAIFDLVGNTATTSSAKPGNNGGFWGSVLTSAGTIFFCREDGNTTGIFEYDTVLDTGSNIINTSALTSPGYGITNLPNGNVFITELKAVAGSVTLIINPVNKSVQTNSSTDFAMLSGLCVGQNGHVYGIVANTLSSNGIYGFNTTTNTGFKTSYDVIQPAGGNRGYQDLFSLSDGRLIAMPGEFNNGRVQYWTYLNNPNSNTFPSIGAANPIMTNGKGV